MTILTKKEYLKELTLANLVFVFASLVLHGKRAILIGLLNCQPVVILQ